jgi:hypothetical protein
MPPTFHFYPRLYLRITQRSLRGRRLSTSTSLNIYIPPLFGPFSSNAGLRNSPSFPRLSVRLDDLVTYYLTSISSRHSGFKTFADKPRTMEMAEHLDRQADAEMRELLEVYRPALRRWALSVPSVPTRMEDFVLPPEVEQGFRIFSFEPRRTRGDRYHGRSFMPEDMRRDFSLRPAPLKIQHQSLSVPDIVRPNFRDEFSHLPDLSRHVSFSCASISGSPSEPSIISRLEEIHSIPNISSEASAPQSSMLSGNQLNAHLSRTPSLIASIEAIRESGTESANFTISPEPFSRGPVRQLRRSGNWLKRHSLSLLSTKKP